MTAEITNLSFWIFVLLITAIGVLSKLVYHFLGRKGLVSVTERVPKLNPERLEQVQRQYKKFGSRSLPLESIPGIGSVIAPAAGAFCVHVLTFILLVFISIFVRKFLVVYIVDHTLSLLPGK